jgi:hypothetical protein
MEWDETVTLTYSHGCYTVTHTESMNVPWVGIAAAVTLTGVVLVPLLRRRTDPKWR